MTEAAKLEPCPFCGHPLTTKRGKVNPYAVCTTEDCFGSKMPVVSLDVPRDVEAWNARARSSSEPDAVRALEHALVRFECLADQFEEAGDTASWAMASVDTDRMRNALVAVRSHFPAESTRPRDFLAWAVEMFGPVAKLRGERLMRFVEEALEVAHADEMERATLDAIANRVYSRAAGEITKEIGQAQACLETYCENIGENASLLAELEWQRVRRIPRSEWQRRHEAKQAIGIALTEKRPPSNQEAGK